MCHENKMGAAKEQHPYIICRLDKQKWWNSSGTVTRPLFRASPIHYSSNANRENCVEVIIPRLDDVVNHHSPATSSVPQELSCVQSVWSGLTQ